jgi:hypothetical protein
MTTDPNLRTFSVTMNAKTCDRQDYTARDLADVIIGEHLFADVEVTENEPQVVTVTGSTDPEYERYAYGKPGIVL